MPKLFPIKPYRLCKVLEKLGFEEKRQTGSHRVFEHPDGRITIVPFHTNREIDRKLLSGIIKKELQMTVEEFQKLL
ncbi:MAG: type II toxin-antitoxin system HicA family toxin [Candidatus Micrarchaeota archaeon]